MSGVVIYIVFLSKVVIFVFMTIIHWIKKTVLFFAKPIYISLKVLFFPLIISAKILRTGSKKMRFLLGVQRFKLTLSIRSIKKTFRNI